MEITAAVIEELGADFVLKQLNLEEPRADEVLIEIVGVGICHTDLAVQHGHLPFALPGVVGHEGSGRIAAIGSDVTKVAVGDSVAMSFNSCGSCTQCLAGFPSYCHTFMELNFGGVRPDGSSPIHDGDTAVGSNFFGQSSFATHAIVRERNVVKVDSAIALELVGPLGCGIQTGAGAILNSLDCQAGSSLLVVGGGSVGLAAVLAAVARELTTIIVVEPVAARRELALSLGATHAIDPDEGVLSELVRGIVPEGVNYAVDTTALLPVLAEIVLSLAQRGKLGMLGVPTDFDSAMPVHLMGAQARGLTFVGVCEGDSEPDVFIPELIDLYLAGKFPFDRLITTVPFAKLNDGVGAQARGEAVKIVLVHE
jgi:aryl-alcohol dehydrogenase